MRFLGRIFTVACVAVLFTVGSWAQLTKGFRGKVMDMSGKPVAGCKVVLEDEANPQNHYEVKTDSSGYFVQTGLTYTDKAYKITVEVPDLPPMIKIEKPKLMDLIDLNFDPRKGVAIMGSVKDKQGKIVTGAKITIVNLADESKPMTATTDGKGNYKKADLPFTDKGYRITGEIPGEQPIVKNIGVQQIAPLDVSFNFGANEETSAAVGGTSAAAEAKQLYEMNDYEGALGKADECIAKDVDPNNQKLAKLIKASSLDKLERTDEAIQAYEAYNTAYPGSIDVIGSLAKLYEAKGDKAKAEAYKKEFQAKGGKVSGEMYNKGVLAFNSGDMAKAAEYFEKAIQEDPNDLDAERQLGTVFGALGKFKDAVPHLEKYLQKRPDASDKQTVEAILQYCKDQLNAPPPKKK